MQVACRSDDPPNSPKPDAYNGRYDKRQHSCGLAGRRLQLYDSACAT